MRITKVYTRTGDKGSTQLVDGSMVPKSSPRIEATGTVDELNAVVGLARLLTTGTVDERLELVQNRLFDLGADLSTPAEGRWPGMVRLTAEDVTALEGWMDEMNESLEPLREFILPGGGPLSAHLHMARTVCRRAERRVSSLTEGDPSVDGFGLMYLNRLSDLFFVMSRFVAKQGGHPETLWKNPSTRAR